MAFAASPIVFCFFARAVRGPQSDQLAHLPFEQGLGLGGSSVLNFHRQTCVRAM